MRNHVVFYQQPTIEGLLVWSGPNCSQWRLRSYAEKQMWIRNYYWIYSLVPDDATVHNWIMNMDLRCKIGIMPAGDVYTGLDEGFSAGLNSSSDTSSNSSSDNSGIDWTNPNIQKTFQTGINAIAQAAIGITNSANKTNYGYPGSLFNPTSIPRSPTGGIYGGFNTPFGYGYGASTFTPFLIIGGLVIVGGIVLLSGSRK